VSQSMTQSQTKKTQKFKVTKVLKFKNRLILHQTMEILQLIRKVKFTAVSLEKFQSVSNTFWSTMKPIRNYLTPLKTQTKLRTIVLNQISLKQSSDLVNRLETKKLHWMLLHA
jgi:hypothetical protein